MLRASSAALLAVLLALAPPTAAQTPLKVGDRLPPVALENLTQSPVSSFSDFYGRTVLLEFFAYWCGPCGASVPHLNELQREYGPRGFSIVAVTSEPAKKTEPWIAKQRAEYAYGYDPKGTLQTLFQVRGIPFGALIDPYGTVVWTGHPMTLKDETIEQALAGALAKPLWEWPQEMQALAPLLQRGEYGAAMELARTLPAELEAEALVRSRYQPLVARFSRLVEEKDWVRVVDFGAELERGLAGLPEREAVVAKLAELRADEALMREVTSTKRIAELEARASALRNQTEAETLRGEVAAFLKDQAGGKHERRAQALLDAIDRALERARAKKDS